MFLYIYILVIFFPHGTYNSHCKDYKSPNMCTTDRRTGRRPQTSDVQGEIQDPLVSSSIQNPCPTFIKPRIGRIRVDCVGLFYPVPNSDMDTVNLIETKPSISTFKATILVIIILVSALLAMRLVFKLVPDLDEEERKYLRMPLDIEDAKQLGWLLNRYKDKYFYQVLFGVSSVYIFLQTFAIPGSIFLSILSGFLFPFPVALTLVCSCSAVGASLCFFISNLLARRLVLKYLPTRAAEWSTAVNKHKDNLLNYIIFLRVTPFLPNWFINMTAPVVGVPLKPFALGTFIGVAPPSFVAIQAGQTLHTLTSTSDAWSWTSIAVLSGFALISLIPVFLKDKLRKKFE